MKFLEKYKLVRTVPESNITDYDYFSNDSHRLIYKPISGCDYIIYIDYVISEDKVFGALSCLAKPEVTPAPTVDVCPPSQNEGEPDYEINFERLPVRVLPNKLPRFKKQLEIAYQLTDMCGEYLDLIIKTVSEKGRFPNIND